MKKFVKFITCAALAVAPAFAFVGCGGTDYSKDIADLQAKIETLETENDALQSGLDTAKGKITELETENDALQTKLEQQKDLFTGSPNFFYDIGDTIPYYINGTKIFDFKITEFLFEPNNAAFFSYSVTFTPSFKKDPAQVFSATAYDTVTQSCASSSINVSTSDDCWSMRIETMAGNQKIIVLYYAQHPFASITATPTQQ